MKNLYLRNCVLLGLAVLCLVFSGIAAVAAPTLTLTARTSEATANSVWVFEAVIGGNGDKQWPIPADKIDAYKKMLNSAVAPGGAVLLKIDDYTVPMYATPSSDRDYHYVAVVSAGLNMSNPKQQPFGGDTSACNPLDASTYLPPYDMDHNTLIWAPYPAAKYDADGNMSYEQGYVPMWYMPTLTVKVHAATKWTATASCVILPTKAEGGDPEADPPVEPTVPDPVLLTSTAEVTVHDSRSLSLYSYNGQRQVNSDNAIDYGGSMRDCDYLSSAPASNWPDGTDVDSLKIEPFWEGNANTPDDGSGSNSFVFRVNYHNEDKLPPLLWFMGGWNYGGEEFNYQPKQGTVLYLDLSGYGDYRAYPMYLEDGSKPVELNAANGGGHTYAVKFSPYDVWGVPLGTDIGKINNPVMYDWAYNSLPVGTYHYFFGCSDDSLMFPKVGNTRYGFADYVLGCQPDDPFSSYYGGYDPDNQAVKSEWGVDYQGYYDYQNGYDLNDFSLYRNYPGYADNNALDPMLSRWVSNYEYSGTIYSVSSSDGLKNDSLSFEPDGSYYTYDTDKWYQNRFKGQKIEITSGDAQGNQYTILSQSYYSMVLDAADLEADGVKSDDTFKIVGSCMIGRDAHRRYSAAAGSEFDDTLFVDRPVRAPGYFEDTPNAKYGQPCTVHPEVTCSLSVDRVDANGIAYNDIATYGGGRFFGTLSPYRRMVNPLLPGAVQNSELSRRAEFSGDILGKRFEFRIKYRQKDGNPPLYIKLWVNNASSYSKIDAQGDGLPASAYQYTSYPMQADSGTKDYAGAGVWYRYSLVLPAGPHTYYFEASDGLHTVVWPRRPDKPATGIAFQDWWLPTQSTIEHYGTAAYDNNDYVPGPYVNTRPVLSRPAAGYVTPTSGKMGDTFRFSVKYTDADGQRPYAAYVHIQTSDGTVKKCQMQPTTPLDPTKDNRALYKGGVTYYYDLSTAQDKTVQTGSRKFYFEFVDDWGRQTDDSDTVPGETVRITDDGKQWKEGPTISGPIAPTLSEGKTESADGTANSATLWKFSVKYTDANNDAPKAMLVYVGRLQEDGATIIWDSGNQMLPTDPSDQVYTDGATYFYQTRLPGQESPDDTAKTYYYAFVANDGTMWAEYNALTSPSAAVVRNALVGTGDGNQTSFTIVPPIAGAPLVGPLKADLPSNPNDLSDAQLIIGGTKELESSVWNIVGGQLQTVNDQMSGWEAAPRFSVMKAAATTLDGAPSAEYVIPEQIGSIASVKGVYATRADLMSDTNNLYEPNMAAPGTQEGTADAADAAGLTILPDNADAIGGIMEVTGENGTGDIVPIVSAKTLVDGKIIIGDPAEALIDGDGNPKYVKINIKYYKSEYVVTTNGVPNLKDQSGLTLMPADNSGVAWPTSELWRIAKVLQVTGDLMNPDTGALIQAGAVIASAGDVNAKSVIPIVDPAEKLFKMGYNPSTGQNSPRYIYRNIKIQYLRGGFVAGNKLIWLTTPLADEYKGQTVYIKYNDVCFTHQLLGFATDAIHVISGGYGVTHYRPNQGNTTVFKGNLGDDVDPASAIIGVWADYERALDNYFNTYRGSRYPENDFSVNALQLTTEVPSGTDQLWARFYQKGSYNVDRSNGSVEFASPVDNGVSVWSNYIFGTKIKDKNGQDVTIGANTPPTLLNGKLDKEMGQRTDSFVFSVTYRDTDGPTGQAPAYVKVYIDDVAYDMATGINGSTPPYRQGATFTYVATGLSGGSHRYRFEASDGAATAIYDYYDSTQNTNGTPRPTSGANLIKDINGPWVNDVPLLTLGTAAPNPTPGTIGTSQTVDYTVLYTDLDNDLPFEFDTVMGDIVGQTISGTPSLWVDGDPDISYSGKVVDFVADTFEPSKSRTVRVKTLDGEDPNWTPNQFAGRLMQITNGSIESQVFLIYTNTANELTISTNDLHTDGFVSTPGSETEFQINGIKMSKLNAEEQDFTKGIMYKITVPKLAVGNHRFHFTARSRLKVPAWLSDQVMTGTVDATGLIITPSAPLKIETVTGVFTDTICQAPIPSATTGLLDAQNQIVIANAADKLSAGATVYIKYRMAPYSDLVRDPATGDHTGPNVVLQAPDGNKAPTLGGGVVLSGPFGKRADAASSTRVTLNTDDTTGNWSVLEADSVRYVMGVYLNATLDSNDAFNTTNYLTTPVGVLPSDHTFDLTASLPAVADGTALVQIGVPDGDSLLRVVPDAPGVIASVTGVYLTSDLTGTNYYGSVSGGKIIVSQPLPSGTRQVFVKYTKTGGPLPVYIKYLRAKPVAPAKFPYGDPVTLRVNYSDPDGDAPTMHDGVEGYLNLILSGSTNPIEMLPVAPITGNYTIPRPFAWTLAAMPAGVNKFHYAASDGYDLADPLTTHAIRYPVLAADDFSFDVNSKPVLSLGSITPTEWHPSTDFTFKVHYTDADGTGTTPSVRVRLYRSTGTPAEYIYPMNTTGTNFVAGVDYKLTMPSTDVPMLTPGTYRVTFEATDGTQYGDALTLAQTIFVRPSNSSPIIVSTSVTPGFGKISTAFVYRAYFRDPDGDPPILRAGMYDNAKHDASLLLIVDKGLAGERKYLMTKAASAPATPNYAIAGGVAFETAPGIQINTNRGSIHTYEVQASDGELDAVPVSVNNAPIANRAPSIVSHLVTPTVGGVNVKFVYRANFRDADGDAPVVVQNGVPTEGLLLIIDKGTSREKQVVMTKAAGMPASPDYTAAGGVTFETAPGVNIDQSSDAIHTYEIHSSDGLLDGAVVSASDMPKRNRGPVIVSHSVDPTYGTVNTSFVYRATYSDPDNDAPVATLNGVTKEGLLLTIDKGTSKEVQVIMTKAASEPANPNYASSTGVAYETAPGIQVKLSGAAIHTYQIDASDGLRSATPVVVNDAPGDRRPVIVSHSLTPAAGGLSIKFVYQAKYMDPDGEAPIVKAGLYDDQQHNNAILLIIDKGTAREKKILMAKAASESANPDYTAAAGVLYDNYPGVNIDQSGTEIHTYEMQCSDGLLDAVAVTGNDQPLRNRAPKIVSHTVTPGAGKVSTKFVYQARYMDPDNDPPVSTIDGNTSEGLVLVIDKGTNLERKIRMTKSTTMPAKPDYTAAAGVLYETAGGITMNGFGSIIHSYEIEVSDGLLSGVPGKATNVPVHLVPRFEQIRAVSASSANPDSAVGLTTASVGDNVLIVGLIKFPKNSVYPKPLSGNQLSIRVTRPDGNVILLGGYVTMQPDSTDPIYWIGKIKVSEYTKDIDPALVTNENLTLSDGGDWKFGALRVADTVWDSVETDTGNDGVNDGFKLTVGGPMRVMSVSDPTNPATSTPNVDMITPAMVIADGDVGHIFGYDWAAQMQIVRWDPTTKTYFRYGSGSFPLLNPGEAVWIKPLLSYSPETATQASIDTGLLTAPSGYQLLGNRQYRIIHTLSKAYPTQTNATSGLTELAPSVVPLYSGWNQFGNIFTNWKKDTSGKPVSPRQDVGIPFSEVRVRYLNQELSIADAAAAGWIRNYAYRFDAATRKYVLVDATEPGADRVLKAWAGYWIRSFVDCDLVIDPNTTYNGAVIAPAVNSLNGVSRRTLDLPPAMPGGE